MNVPGRTLVHGDLTGRILGAFFDVHTALGHGFLESVYERALLLELRTRGMMCERQVPLSVEYRGRNVGAFRIDVLVENTVLLELKACRAIDAAHLAQLQHYLRASGKPVGLLLNFGTVGEFRRMVGPAGRGECEVRESVPPWPSVQSVVLHSPG